MGRWLGCNLEDFLFLQLFLYVYSLRVSCPRDIGNPPSDPLIVSPKYREPTWVSPIKSQFILKEVMMVHEISQNLEGI